MIAAWLFAGPAAAHNLPYALATLTLRPDGGYRLTIACDTAALVLGAPQGRLQPEAKAALDALPDAEIARRSRLMADYLAHATVLTADGRPFAAPPPRFPTPAEVRLDGAMTPQSQAPSAPLVFEGRLPGGTSRFAVRLAPELGQALLKVEGGGSQPLAPAQTSAPVAVALHAPHPVASFGRYLALGFAHILPGGLDHILFVLSLFLLAPRPKPLAWQVTGFTLAHSLTLSLAVFGFVGLPSRWVETAIAVSIAVMALDNLRSREMAPWRPAVVFGFGLLHGLGFANVLQELGLPRGEEVLALAGFNLGIEAGQLTVLALAFGVVGWTITRPWYRARVAWPASLAIAAVAAAWAVERALP